MAIFKPWLFILLPFIITAPFAFTYYRKKSMGYLALVIGQVDKVENSTVYLYPNKIIINNLQIISKERLRYAEMTKHTRNQYIGSGMHSPRESFVIHIGYIDVEGKNMTKAIVSRENDGQGSDYLRFCEELNSLVGYVAPKGPTLPHEI
ncbi:hypothetical protein [Paenibacillus sp. MMO-177]|uniref:hypothetical protein n=1 Tax=Paenibacillus sp. MMO-177 TaxID=3081289 RepID=UPI003019599F